MKKQKENEKRKIGGKNKKSICKCKEMVQKNFHKYANQEIENAYIAERIKK